MSLFDRQPTTRERTPEDRERARAEREARRAARDGREPVAPDPTVAAPRVSDGRAEPETPPEPRHEPTPARQAPASQPEREPDLELTAATARHAQAPATRADPAAPRAVPTATEQPPPDPGPSFIDEPMQEDGSALEEDVPMDGDPDRVAPGRRWRSRARPGRPPREPRAPRAAGRRSGLRRWIPLALFVLVVLALGWFAISLFQPFHGDGNGFVQVRVPTNSGVSGVADALERRGVISSGFFFGLRVRLSGHSGDLHPGLYDLRRNMGYGAVIDALVKGPAAAKTLAVTIGPGRSIRQTAARLSQAHIPLRGSYAAAARRSPVLNPVSYGAPRPTPNLEGFLYPDTYEIRVGGPAAALVTEQLQAFKKQFAKVDLRGARRKNLNAYDVLIIASMIEREADLNRERPIIAEVIYNRLKQGIPIGIDATTRYEHNNFTAPLRQQDFDNSPYNTRTHKDLPPTPIGNPGLKSIQAAARPASGAYLYYVVKPGVCGEHAFSTTYDQFLRDANRYGNARAARGGNSPTTCR